jgi:23S rRNA (uracil1939-C5)-methyltransferase
MLMMETTVTLEIQKIVAGGEGLAFLDGRVVFIPYVAPGEQVKAIISQKSRDWLRATPIEVLKASQYRVSPPCSLYGICGGCDLQHISYDQQLAVKTSIVKDSFKRIGKIDIDTMTVVPSAPISYRNRIQLHRSPCNKIGYKQLSSSNIVEISTCPIAVEPIRSWIESSVKEFPDSSKRQPIDTKDRFIVFSPGQKNDRIYIEGIDSELCVKVLERDIVFNIDGFFQSNLLLFNDMITTATSNLSGSNAADLYCGVGPFASCLSDSFDKVVCVEQSSQAIRYAKTNVGERGDFYALSVEDWTKTQAATNKYDAVICDPPRSGLEQQVRSWMIQSRPNIISYVSCNPVTCARDVGDFVRSGYSISQIHLFDFYPQTSHIELCVRLMLE